MAAIDQDAHAVLAQVSVVVKTKEITLFPVLMDHFTRLKGVVVSAGALHAQSGHARHLADRGAHYIFTVKAHRPTHLLKQLAGCPWDRVPNGRQTREKANGRQVIRTVKCATLRPKSGFLHAEQAVQITRKSRLLGATAWHRHTETVYALTSLPTHQGSPT